jgi:hypothetical protein
MLNKQLHAMGDVIANEGIVMKDSIFYSKIMNQIIFNKLKINKNLD